MSKNYIFISPVLRVLNERQYRTSRQTLAEGSVMSLSIIANIVIPSVIGFTMFDEDNARAYIVSCWQPVADLLIHNIHVVNRKEGKY
jgi:hypothetical protein